MIEQEIYARIKDFLTGSASSPLYAYRDDVVRIHQDELRGDKSLLIGVENGRSLAPGVPFRQFDVVLGFAIKYTEPGYRSILETVISAIRSNTDDLAANLKAYTGTEIASVDAFYPAVQGAETEGVDESDKYFMHNVTFTLFLSRKDK